MLAVADNYLHKLREFNNNEILVIVCLILTRIIYSFKPGNYYRFKAGFLNKIVEKSLNFVLLYS
jgi:hypothetical protein